MQAIRPVFLASSFLVAFLGTAQIPAWADNVENGREIAVRWCASCHDVGVQERRSANDLAPSFAAVASRGELSRTQLESWIGHPHPPMPNFNLSRQTVSDLVDYIESLRRPQ